MSKKKPWLRKVLFRRAFQNTQKGCCIIYNNPLIKTGIAHRILSFYKSYCKYPVRSSGRKAFSYSWFIALLPSLSRLRRFSFRKAKNPSSFRNWDFTQTGNARSYPYSSLLRRKIHSIFHASLSRFGRAAITALKKQSTSTLCFLPKPAMSYFPRQPPAKYLRRWGA